MVGNVSDEAWLMLIERLDEIEPGDEIWWSHFGEEIKASLMLEQAADMGMIKQIDEDTWEKREPIVDRSPREE